MAHENEILRDNLRRKQEARGERENEREPAPRGNPGSPMNEALRGDMAGKRRETLRRVLTKAGHHDDITLMDAEDEAREARRLADKAKRRAEGR
jgi:hypothetical protein